MSSLSQTSANNQKLPQKEAGIFKKIVVSEREGEGGWEGVTLASVSLLALIRAYNCARMWWKVILHVYV